MNIEDLKNSIDVNVEMDGNDDKMPPIDMDNSMTDLKALP